MKIGAVIVTYNRLGLLKELLETYSSFDHTPDMLLIVNNNSTDGTKEYLEKWQKDTEGFEKSTITLTENIGGSGGFYEGIKFLIDKNYDWVWVCDDDAFPERETFRVLRDNLSCFDQDVAAISVSVVDGDGKYQLSHRRKISRSFPFKEEAVEEIFYEAPFEYDLFSFVGVLIRSENIKKIGLPERDYFIFYDDTEHSIRIRKTGRIICLPQLKVLHRQASFLNEGNWKSYYSIRNKLLMLKKHYFFSFITEASLLY